MPIEKNKVVTLHYTLFNADDDREIERSTEQAPLIYLHGANNILAALETALAGKNEDDAVTVTLEAEDAYGHHDDGLHQRLSAKYLKHAGKLTPGKVVRVQTEQGARMVTVLKVGLKTVDVDANHPLADQRLRFEMTVASVRDASAEEIAHGHAHGPGGHSH